MGTRWIITSGCFRFADLSLEFGHLVYHSRLGLSDFVTLSPPPPPPSESCFGCAASGTVFRDLRTMRRMLELFLHGLIIALLVLRAFLWPPLSRRPRSLKSGWQMSRALSDGPVQWNYLRMTFTLDAQVEHSSG